MSAGVLKLFGAAVLCVIVIAVVRRGGGDGALTLKMLSGVILAGACAVMITPIVEFISEIGESFGTGESFSVATEVLLKALGVAFLTHICATVCRDAGEGSVAAYVELGGKIEILLLSLPLLKELLDTALKLLEM